MNNIIEIAGTEYRIRNTLRSFFVYESITKKPFEIKTLLDNYVFFYSVILACNKDCTLTFDELIDALDENPRIYDEFQRITTARGQIEELHSEAEKEGEGEKKN